MKKWGTPVKNSLLTSLGNHSSTYSKLNFRPQQFYIFSEGGRDDAVPGKEAVFRGVQVSAVQAEVDERQLVGKYGTGMWISVGNGYLFSI